MISLFNTSVNQEFSAYKKAQYNKIYNHEMAHKKAAGSLGGSIVIEKDKNGVPIGGHISIKMPVVDPNNPNETITDAKRVINSALAPSDPSSQDIKVANEAKSILQQATNQKNNQDGSKLNYIA